MDINLQIELDKVLTACRDEGSVFMTKDTDELTRLAINEAESRGWLAKSQPGVYRLTSPGLSVLDAGGVDSYMKIRTLSLEIKKPKIKQFSIKLISWKVVIPCSPVEFITMAVTIIGVIATILQLLFGIF